MRQVVLQQPGEFLLRQVPDPVPAAGDVLVRVRRIGICGTDLHAFAGRQPFFSYPRVLGHELSVTVEALPQGDAAACSVGDTCVVRPFLNNPESRATRRGRPNCCEELRVLGVHVDGGMGDLLAIPPRFLHPVTDADLDVLALVEPLSIGCHAVARAALTKNDDVLVIGAGPIGLARAAVRRPRRRPRHRRRSLPHAAGFRGVAIARRGATSRPHRKCRRRPLRRACSTRPEAPRR